ncbi:MAG: tRNA uridine-5-carboxymethylaminomethyl(34) synthesis GTPase MnmE, partial [Acidaminococcaceae bacterium]|nr:tRNA uridine-5-carboxymethylaminomethyl(34) synthesis GTPase MnmE [Acidaminococcaceae bacterium]
MEETISAIATALGEGAVGIIRISGPRALVLANAIFKGTAPLSLKAARHLTYGHIVDEEGHTVDEVLAVFMPGPHSYTGDDVVEIQCHGGVEALKCILALTYRIGAKPAEPGEFTKRAFLNGRLDLTEAEAVMDIIQARSAQALSVAVRAQKGQLSQQVSKIRNSLKDLIVHLEATIDYPEDDIEAVTYGKAEEGINNAIEAINELLTHAHTGRIMREGLRTAIVGKPNVGKSSLLNC